MPSYCSLDIFSFKDSHLLFCHFNILKNYSILFQDNPASNNFERK